MKDSSSMRTPLSRVRFLGSAHSGTGHFWAQRVSAVALVPLSIAFVLIVVSLLGRNHAAAVQILGSPFVAIVMILFVIASTYHMRLGMQVIIEDYVHNEFQKVVLLMLNTFFTVIVGALCLFAVLKTGFAG